MKPYITMDDGLLMKYLLREADVQEVKRIEIWLQDNAGNQKHFNDLKFIWEESLRLTEGNENLESTAWSRIEDRLNFNGPSPVALKTKDSGYKPLLLLAASILLICSLGWLLFNHFKTPDMVNVAAKDQVMTLVLPDETNVTLNKNTVISYPGKFNGATRPVKLKGEAFFHVTRNASKPFIISVNEVTVKVLGTSFNVKRRDGKTVIVVETGIVRVSKLQNSIELHRGEYVAIDSQQTTLIREKNKNNLYAYYRSNKLNCENTPLQELVDVLNEKFNTNIVIVSPALKSMPITADFTNKSPDEIMSVISMTFKIHVESKNQQILLK